MQQSAKKRLRTSVLIRAGLMLGLSLAVTADSPASTFSAVADYSSSNPSGAWAYGTGLTGSSFTPMSVYVNNDFGISGLSQWNPAVQTNGSNAPAIIHNGTGTTFYNNSTVVLPTNVLLLAPGSSTDVIVQWTAPSAGTYNISGLFEVLDTRPTGIIGEIFDNSIQIYGGTLAGPGAVAPGTAGGSETFSLTETLAAGAVISFGVNNAGNYFDDSTGLSAMITSADTTAPTTTPEPATMSLAVGGIALVLIGLRRKRVPTQSKASRQ